MSQQSPSPILSVVIDTPLRRRFDYLPPPAGASGLRPGMRLSVPFGKRRVIGYLVEIKDDSELPRARLKAAFEVLDSSPLWDEPTLALLLWAADYYHHAPGEVLAGAVPLGIREGAAASAWTARWRLSTAGESVVAAPPRLGARQRALLERLASGPVDHAGLEPPERAALRGFVEKGWIESFEEPSAAPPPGRGDGRAPTLTAAQQAATSAISGALDGYSAWLLHGVTGSGKTEVYLQVIAEVLARGRQALVLVPEIALTPQLLGRFRQRLAVPVVSLNSSMTDTERLAAWRAARGGAAPVVVGTRSAVFTPLPELGLIVVDEEHDSSFKQQEGFRYSARDLAVARASRLGIPVVLGSATPSLETLVNAREGRYQHLSLPERAGSAGKPRVAVVDLRRHAARDGIAQPTLAAIECHLAARGQVLVYLNRRGYAPTLFCPGCGWMAPCPACDARLTVHMGRSRLVCHHCGADEPMPYGCPKCASELRPVGQGTERVEQTLNELFPEAPLVRIDRDVIRHRGHIEKALDDISSGRARILLGTQMLAKGHDYPDVTLVAVLNADQGLFGADFRAAERLAQQIIQVAGRAGRGDRPGEVLVQTSFPEHPLLISLVHGGYEAFADGALAERKLAGWPPYSRLAVLRADAASRDEARSFLDAALEAARSLDTRGVRLLGPAIAAMERRAHRYRAQVLIESAQRGPLHRLIDQWLPLIEALPGARAVRWSIDVDPIEVD